MPIEYEAKFIAIDKDVIRQKLNDAGYQCILPEFLYRRQVFDVPGAGPEKWGRVRWEKEVINLSIKHTVDVTSIDGTHEHLINIPINENPMQQYHDAIDFMIACGMTPAGEQENKREIWTKGDVEICIDTWPGVKPYVEIESMDEATVRAASHELGFDFSTALFGGITTIYETELGISVNDFAKIKTVTFDNPPRAKQGV